MSAIGLPGLQTAQNWFDSSVQEFFKTCNWDDHAIEVQDIQLASLLDENISLELTLSVSHFFAAINWDGSSFTAPTILEVPIASNSQEDTFTLTDFSDLFD
jgi:hypothetical protein